MRDAERDLGTRLGWVAVDIGIPTTRMSTCWSAGAPTTARTSSLAVTTLAGAFATVRRTVTLEMGPRSEQEIRAGLEKEVEAERWTSLDRALRDSPTRAVASSTFVRAATAIRSCAD